MIKRYLSNLRNILLPLIGWVSFMQFANAQTASGAASGGILSFMGFPSLNALLSEATAIVSSILLSITNYWVAFTGALLNTSITMTLHISDFVASTQGVYLVWQTIRDISGMFIIFLLLFASFKLILSRGEAASGVGNLIKNVVIVGILINFSFFITSLLIDASNIVSMALYNAIVIPTVQPLNSNTTQACASKNGGTSSVNTCLNTAQTLNGSQTGLSGIFMSYLNPQIIYTDAPSTNTNNAQNQKPLMIIIQGIVGSIIQITVGLSFLLASLAFVVRLIVLIFLLAFSPIWFASWVIPQLEDKAKEFTDTLKSQLIFMPVYLLLLYAALNVLSNSTIFTNPTSNSFMGSGVSGWIPTNYIVLAINDFFIIFLLNLPLVVAFSMGGVASKWIKTDKFNSKAIWGRAGNAVRWSGKAAYQDTVSRAASAVSRSEGLKNWAGRSQIGEYALQGVKKTASTYDKKLDAQVKSRTEFAESLGVDQRALNAAQATLRTHQQALATAKAGGAATAAGIPAIEASIRAARTNVQNIENARKNTYSNRTDTRQVDTLFTKVARKDKVAAAKVQMPIIEKQLTQAKDDLKETRADLKQLNNTITNLPAGTSPTTAQTNELSRLQGKEIRDLARVNTLEGTMDGLKLVK